MCNETKDKLENAVLTAGEIVDSFIISAEIERYLYPYQLPVVSRGLPGITMENMNFLQDPRYAVYLVSKRISGDTLGTKGLKIEVIDTEKNLEQPGTRFVLPEGITIQELVDKGFLLKLERGKQGPVPHLGDPYIDKGFYDPKTGKANWPAAWGFKNLRFSPRLFKRFSFVDRFGSDQGSFLCPARFKSPEQKYEACSKVLEEIKQYKQKFIEQIIDPLVNLLFNENVTIEFKPKLKSFMKGLCVQYYSIKERPKIRETNFSEDEWREYLTIIFTNLKLQNKDLTEDENPNFIKSCVTEILGNSIRNTPESEIEPRINEYVQTRAQGKFTAAETLYDWYLNLINVDDIGFGEQEVLINAMESGMFEEMVQNLKPDIFSMENPSDGEKSDLLLMLIPYLAVNITVWNKTLFSIEFLLKHEIASNIFNVTEAIGKFELSESTSDFIISRMENYPITERALSSNAEITEEYNVYMVLDTLRGIYGLAAPWYSSKGDAEQIKLYKNSYIDQLDDSINVYPDSCDTLLREGFLLRVVKKKKQERLPMLYGGSDK